MGLIVAAEIAVAVITLIGVCVTAWFGYKAAIAGRAINDAVNNRHPTQPKLYDAVLSHSEEIKTLSGHVESNSHRLDALHATMVDHIENGHKPTTNDDAGQTEPPSS